MSFLNNSNLIPEQELVGLRKKRQKWFDNGDGTKRLLAFGKNIHYLKDSGEYDEIDVNFQLDDKEENYLVLKNEFTYGFRNDKNSYKFLGIRKGYDYQFELTPFEIVLDDKTIAIPEALQAQLGDINSQVEHTIDESTSLLSIAGNQFLRTAIKTTAYISDFKIRYKVHLKNINILNEKVGDEYTEENGRFSFELQNTNKDILYLADPIMWSGDNVSGEITQRLYEENGELIYEKTPTDNGKDWLLLAESPLFIDGTAYYGAAANDAIIQSSGTSWDTVHDATSGTATMNNSSALFGTAKNKGTYYIYRQCHEFDTSGIDDSATISAAALYLKCSVATYASTVLNVFQGSQATPPVAGDYDAFGDTSFGKSSGSWTADTYKSITLNSSGISAINKTGSTKLFFRDDYDLNDVATSGSTYITLYMSDQSGTDSDPYLDITTGSASNDFAVANESSASSIDNIALTQAGGTFAIADAAVVPSVENVALEQTGEFETADIVSPSSVEEISLEINGGELEIADEISESTIENISLEYEGGTLEIADEISASSIENIDLKYQGNFDINDEISASSIDNIVLERNGGDFAIADENSPSSIENIQLIGDLRIDNENSESSIDNISIERNGGDFETDNVDFESFIDNVTLEQTGSLGIHDIETVSSIENIDLEFEGGTLEVGEIICATEIDNLGLEGNFVIDGMTCEATTEEIELEFSGGEFTIADIASTATVENIDLIGEFKIDSIHSPPAIDNIALEVGGGDFVIEGITSSSSVQDIAINEDIPENLKTIVIVNRGKVCKWISGNKYIEL